MLQRQAAQIKCLTDDLERLRKREELRSRSERDVGTWSDEEKAIMRDVFSGGYSSELVTIAVGKLRRDRAQVRAMAGNMKLRKPFSTP